MKNKKLTKSVAAMCKLLKEMNESIECLAIKVDGIEYLLRSDEFDDLDENFDDESDEGEFCCDDDDELGELEGRINHLAIRAQGRAKDISALEERIANLEALAFAEKGQYTVEYTLDKEALKPTRAHDTDAGFDLYMPNKDVTYNTSAKGLVVDTGVHMAIPAGYVGLVLPRSGLAARHGVYPVTGVIDSGYTGSIGVTFEPDMIYKNHEVHKGDRIAQIVIVPLATVELKQVEELPKTDRGNKGFGSTGR